VDWQPATANGATFKVFVNPLINWLWVGALVFLLGILVAAWPDREPEYVRELSHRTEQASAAD
jgi:cytochrome c-type biogenesis protein CcmF